MTRPSKGSFGETAEGPEAWLGEARLQVCTGSGGPTAPLVLLVPRLAPGVRQGSQFMDWSIWALLGLESSGKESDKDIVEDLRGLAWKQILGEHEGRKTVQPQIF